jgi:hypothetical protein
VVAVLWDVQLEDTVAGVAAAAVAVLGCVCSPMASSSIGQGGLFLLAARSLPGCSLVYVCCSMCCSPHQQDRAETELCVLDCGNMQACSDA